jgi:mono/diheme cytochrome c family protein
MKRYALDLLLLGFGLTGLGQAFGQAKQDDIPLTATLSGPEMYKSWCASCHGTDGKGDGPAAKALKKAPADLTLIAKRNGGKFPTDRIRKYIDGTEMPPEAHGSREMPIWGNVLKRIDASAPGISYRVVTLTSYLESIQTK